MNLKRLLVLLPAAVVIAGAVLLLPKSGPFVPAKSQRTVYDTSLTILKGFVAAGDRRLGFADTNEMRGAWIDTSNGVPLYYALEDSIVNSSNTNPSNDWIRLHRTMFPVYGREGFLRSAITFDSTPTGWVPVEFDEGAVLRTFVGFHPHQPGEITEGKIVEAPFLQGEFFLGKGANGRETIVLHSEEQAELRKFLPPPAANAILTETGLLRAIKSLETQPHR
jgi:hypothetical protein